MKIKRMVRISLFTTLLCVVTIGIPPIPVPFIQARITLQTMIVMLAGILLIPMDAFLSVFLYVILGLIGLPVFSGLTSGLPVLVGPTGGFIIAFPFAAFLISVFKRQKSYARLFIINFLFGILLIYAVGAVSLSLFHEQSYLLMLKAVLIFIPLDIIKIILAINIASKLKNVEIFNH